MLKNASEEFSSFNLYVEDESRFGLFTRNGKSLTAKGVKPICTYQNIFKSTYIFGAFSPYNGDSLVMELPNCNGENFQIFLNELSKMNPAEFKVMILDNGAFHKVKSLIIPKNIALLFLPPYSPELNPAELVWLQMKRKMTHKIYKTMEELKTEISKMVKNLITRELIIDLCGFDYFFK
ncbi:IS630 family transposase [uncultured Chryseobacterium sp.]|uniref:IS630 family transposase n=2 Tax=uncultured Chryseobacterium sp. TaxID=259322 RepID=UPI0025EC7580|nr:IS630 family transposase [uncultured Chryseobacterium sp.]